MIDIKGKYTTAKVYTDELEESASEQIKQMVDSPAFTNQVSIMPDVHAGAGSVIGFTMPLGDKVIPNIVGVDIGCSVISTEFNHFNFPDLSKLDNIIRSVIPFGYEVRETLDSTFEFPWSEFRLSVLVLTERFIEVTDIRPPLTTNYSDLVNMSYSEYFPRLCKKVGASEDRAVKSIGTLGGGNHFIEFGQSVLSPTQVWLTIHTGSRQLGLKIANYHQNIAKRSNKKEEIDKIKSEIEEQIKAISTDDKEERVKLVYSLNCEMGKRIKALSNEKTIPGLEYLEGIDIYNYLVDMLFAQMYAKLNRATILKTIISEAGPDLGKVVSNIDTVHNYIDFSTPDFMIRKGAVSAQKDEKFVIPLDMEHGVLICEGKGNKEWNYSAPHGAGRRLGRRAAKRTLKLEDFKERMEKAKVFSNNINMETIDESAEAYKDTDSIIKNIEPTAEILDYIIPFHNMKASG